MPQLLPEFSSTVPCLVPNIGMANFFLNQIQQCLFPSKSDWPSLDSYASRLQVWATKWSKDMSETCHKSLRTLGCSFPLVSTHLWNMSPTRTEANSTNSCVLYSKSIMIVLYFDDLGIAYSNKLFQDLTELGLEFTHEGTFTDFLESSLSKIKPPTRSP